MTKRQIPRSSQSSSLEGHNFPTAALKAEELIEVGCTVCRELRHTTPLRIYVECLKAPRTVGELARLVSRTEGTVSRIVGRLQKENLLCRVRCGRTKAYRAAEQEVRALISFFSEETST